MDEKSFKNLDFAYITAGDCSTHNNQLTISYFF